MADPPDKKHGFVSYARKDIAMFRTFQTHLRTIEKNYGVEFWIDEVLETGTDWKAGIEQAIEKADIFVLMLSPAFLASDFIYYTEYPAIESRCSATGAPLIPVYLKQCLYDPLCGHLQIAPLINGRLCSIETVTPRNTGYYTASQKIEQALRDRLKLTSAARAGRSP